MKRTILVSVSMTCLVFLIIPGKAQEKATNKYVGIKVCAPCHKSEKVGNQFGIWQKSKHSDAYKTLTTAKADEIAKGKGLKKSAAESPECLGCHTITANTKLMEKTFDVKDGIQCEMCHGPGSGYKSMSIMKDHAKALGAGLIAYKDDVAIEKLCKTCHNPKSPSYKEFKFSEWWAKIKHSRPKKS